MEVEKNNQSTELLKIVFGANSFGFCFVELKNIGTPEDIAIIIRSLSDHERAKLKAAMDKLQNAFVFANGCTTKS